MGKPRFGAGGKPMFGAGGKPLICDTGEDCCEVTYPTVSCSGFCTGDAAPGAWQADMWQEEFFELTDDGLGGYTEGPVFFTLPAGSHLLDKYFEVASAFFAGCVWLGPVYTTCLNENVTDDTNYWRPCLTLESSGFSGSLRLHWTLLSAALNTAIATNDAATVASTFRLLNTWVDDPTWGYAIPVDCTALAPTGSVTADTDVDHLVDASCARTFDAWRRKRLVDAAIGAIAL